MRRASGRWRLKGRRRRSWPQGQLCRRRNRSCCPGGASRCGQRWRGRRAAAAGSAAGHGGGGARVPDPRAAGARRGAGRRSAAAQPFSPAFAWRRRRRRRRRGGGACGRGDGSVAAGDPEAGAFSRPAPGTETHQPVADWAVTDQTITDRRFITADCAATDLIIKGQVSMTGSATGRLLPDCASRYRASLKWLSPHAVHHGSALPSVCRGALL
jgi:hypothetical protein